MEVRGGAGQGITTTDVGELPNFDSLASKLKLKLMIASTSVCGL